MKVNFTFKEHMRVIFKTIFYAGVDVYEDWKENKVFKEVGLYLLFCTPWIIAAHNGFSVAVDDPWFINYILMPFLFGVLSYLFIRWFGYVLLWDESLRPLLSRHYETASDEMEEEVLKNVDKTLLGEGIE